MGRFRDMPDISRQATKPPSTFPTRKNPPARSRTPSASSSASPPRPERADSRPADRGVEAECARRPAPLLAMILVQESTQWGAQHREP